MSTIYLQWSIVSLFLLKWLSTRDGSLFPFTIAWWVARTMYEFVLWTQKRKYSSSVKFTFRMRGSAGEPLSASCSLLFASWESAVDVEQFAVLVVVVLCSCSWSTLVCQSAVDSEHLAVLVVVALICLRSELSPAEGVSFLVNNGLPWSCFLGISFSFEMYSSHVFILWVLRCGRSNKVFPQRPHCSFTRYCMWEASL